LQTAIFNVLLAEGNISSGSVRGRDLLVSEDLEAFASHGAAGM
jgi:hypothetical protein